MYVHGELGVAVVITASGDAGDAGTVQSGNFYSKLRRISRNEGE